MKNKKHSEGFISPLTVLVLLIITFGVTGVYYLYKNKSTISTQVVTNEPPDNRSLTEKLSLSYVTNTFSRELVYKEIVITSDKGDHMQSVPIIQFKLQDLDRAVLEIVDLSMLSGNIDPLEKVMYFYGVKGPTKLRSVLVQGKLYNFTNIGSAEGLPAGRENCFVTLFQYSDFFTLSEQYAVIVNNNESTEICNNKVTKQNSSLNEKTTEEVLKIIESIKVN